MKVPIRSIFILQHFGIKMTQSEFLGIMLSDGMFDDINKVYFHNLKTNLPLIIHHADHMSVMCEKVKLKKEDNKKLEHFKEIFKGEK
ncbi:MAG: hypothetical protein H8E13_01715 [Actinobacteria bacterium]|nr:hypothetical protein [Actinomycetota bacterium]